MPHGAYVNPDMNFDNSDEKSSSSSSSSISESINSESDNDNEEQEFVLKTGLMNWHIEFQRILESKQNNDLLKWQKLAKLAQDFAFAAKTYGRIIISERHLPESEKNYKKYIYRWYSWW